MTMAANYTPSLRGHIGFHNTLQLVKQHSLEATVRSVWEEIVTEWFPGRHGYKWGFKAPTLANNNMPDVTVIEVRALTQDIVNTEEWSERQIMMIECKRPSSDTPTCWEDTIKAQFREDLSQNLNSSERIYGAVAIGKKVRFFKFDGSPSAIRELVQLHQGTIDMDAPGGIEQVECMMNRIKADGWQWAS